MRDPEQHSRAHSLVYLDEIAHRDPDSSTAILDADNVMGPKSLEAAYHAAGVMVWGIEMVIYDKVDTIFHGT